MREPRCRESLLDKHQRLPRPASSRINPRNISHVPTGTAPLCPNCTGSWRTMYAKMVSITLSEVPVVAILVTLAITAVSVSISLGLSGPPVPAHHRRIGLPKSRSNLRHGPEALQPDQPPRLRSLFIYPIKSCRGIEVPRSRVLPTGLQFDRLYTFAQRRAAPDEPDSPWEFLTQRQKPLLAQVKVDLFLPDHPPTTGGGGVLIVRFPWRDRGLAGLCQLAAAKLARGPRGKPERRFALPLDFPSDGVIKSRGYSYGTVRIWKEATTALNLSSEVPAELSKFLGVTHDLGLFRMDPSRQRHVFRCAPTEAIAGYQPAVDFQDAVRSNRPPTPAWLILTKIPVSPSSDEPEQHPRLGV